MTENKKAERVKDAARLEYLMKISRRGVVLFGLFLISLYVVYFRVYLSQPPAVETSVWGAFGDFVGGLLNPVVAFGALFWLTESVKIQKRELEDTRDELIKQADSGRDSVHLAALTALVNAKYAQINSLNAQIRQISDHIERAHDKNLGVSIVLASAHRDNFESQVTSIELEVARYVVEMERYLPPSRP